MEHAITAETFATVTVQVSKATRPRAAIIIGHAKWVYLPERVQCEAMRAQVPPVPGTLGAAWL